MNSRREFLKTLAVAGAGAMLPANAQNSARHAGRIDVHHHMQPPFYVNAMQDELKRTNFNPRPWTPAVSLDAMDKHNIATSMLSPVQRVLPRRGKHPHVLRSIRDRNLCQSSAGQPHRSRS
jgi:hypothetical protein